MHPTVIAEFTTCNMYGTFITELVGQRSLGHSKGAESVFLQRIFPKKIVRNLHDKFSDVFFLSIKFVEESICQMAATLFIKSRDINVYIYIC